MEHRLLPETSAGKFLPENRGRPLGRSFASVCRSLTHRKSKGHLSWEMKSLEVLADVLRVVEEKGEVQESQSSIQGLVQEEAQEEDVAGKMRVS